MFCVPLRDRQVALQLLLELSIQLGSLHYTLQVVGLLMELCDNGEAEQVDSRLTVTSRFVYTDF